jgi:hypothetical protein
MKDVLIIASAAFGKNICLYSLDKDDYINEIYISACKNPREQRLCLAKAGKKYYAVLTSATQELLPFLKEKVIDEVSSPTLRSSPLSSKDRAVLKLMKIESTTLTTTK